ncbi:ester cyclase [Labrys sp. KB_33_2]|uniref:ester cyclase n=1 Tax=Labrys sp. KB_33_2 TaxID=3237479 RepID=UPI003F92D371
MTTSRLFLNVAIAGTFVLLTSDASLSQSSGQGDRLTGTGKPSAETARLLGLAREGDSAFNARNYHRFLDEMHTDNVKVFQLGVGVTTGRQPHRQEIEKIITAFPDMRVHNDPYDVEFGQGQWTVAMGKLSGTFTGPMQTPDGSTLKPTGKHFETFFTTIARWKGNQIAEEYVMFDPNDIMKQVTP